MIINFHCSIYHCKLGIVIFTWRFTWNCTSFLFIQTLKIRWLVVICRGKIIFTVWGSLRDTEVGMDRFYFSEKRTDQIFFNSVQLLRYTEVTIQKLIDCFVSNNDVEKSHTKLYILHKLCHWNKLSNFPSLTKNKHFTFC